MIQPKLQDYLMFKGHLAQVVGLSDGPHVHIQMQEHDKCPHCNGLLDRPWHDFVISSPLFQENSLPVKTINENRQES